MNWSHCEYRHEHHVIHIAVLIPVFVEYRQRSSFVALELILIRVLLEFSHFESNQHANECFSLLGPIFCFVLVSPRVMPALMCSVLLLPAEVKRVLPKSTN